MTAPRNPKTRTVLRLAGTEVALRLHPADRAFLRDLARVQLLSTALATAHHYPHLKGGAARSLARLERAGLLTAKILYAAHQPPQTLYRFASRDIARAYGGRLPVTGAKRNDLHELLTAQAYFACGRPDDFRLADRLTPAEVSALGMLRPDAVFTDPASGELVLVEADAGHYTQAQVGRKMSTWRARGFARQVWAQPDTRTGAVIPASSHVTVHRF
ncbi:MAG: hypothetical protein ACYDDO_14590 [Acidiferrobacterales bacterium]